MTAAAGPASTVIAALGNALAAEQAATYGYGVVGARLPQGSAQQAAAGTDWLTHMRARDQLIAMIRARGGQPAPPAVAYQLPGPVNSVRQAKGLAAKLEDGVAQAYMGLVALHDATLREYGAGQVRAAAMRAEAWRGSPVAFPGLTASSLQR